MTTDRRVTTPRGPAAVTLGAVAALLAACGPTVEPGVGGSLPEHPAIESVLDVQVATAPLDWQATGLRLRAGQSVTLLGRGDDVGSRVWVRIGKHDIVNLGGTSYTFDAWADGELELIALPPGLRWERCDGTLPPIQASAEPATTYEVRAIAWAGNATVGLEALAADPEIGQALEDLNATRALPDGFRGLCYLARPTTVFEAWSDGERHGVWGNASSSAGIIKKAIDLPLDESTEISFSWRYDALHSLGPETEQAHHDYSSIAVELDNGQDITWMRSPHLETETHFRCPLDWWDERETHIVIQGGREGVGEWQSHTRNVLADYRKAVGGPDPQRIVGVWFISVGAFGGTTADTKYADVVARSGERELAIFD